MQILTVLAFVAMFFIAGVTIIDEGEKHGYIKTILGLIIIVFGVYFLAAQFSLYYR